MTTAPDERIGANIEALRKDRGITQTELAMYMQRQGLKWTQVTVCHVEKGRRPVRLSEAAHVAAAFGVQIDTITAESAPAQPSASRAPLAHLTPRGAVRRTA